MKRLIKVGLSAVVLVIAMTFTSCKPDPGKIIFWVDADLLCGPIDVTINGSTKTISSYYSSSTPDCDATGCATFSMDPGSYNWTATCTGSNWSGTNTVTTNGCFKLQLTP